VNDLRFVERVRSLLAGEGIAARVFGGGAEELLGPADPRPHNDLDLLAADGRLSVASAAAVAGDGRSIRNVPPPSPRLAACSTTRARSSR